MAYTFAEALADDPDRAGWTVASRGTATTRRESMCSVSASLINGTAAGAGFVSRHTSSPITASQLGTQDIVFVATRAERGWVAQKSPALRSRTFTVREAIALGRAPIAPGELERALPRGSNQRMRLGGYPALLSARRGTVTITPPRRKFALFAPPPADPFDIPDVHHENLKIHTKMLQDMQDDVRALHGQIRDFLKSRVVAS